MRIDQVVSEKGDLKNLRLASHTSVFNICCHRNGRFMFVVFIEESYILGKA